MASMDPLTLWCLKIVISGDIFKTKTVSERGGGGGGGDHYKTLYKTLILKILTLHAFFMELVTNANT